jgi:hypothetical protein
MRELVGGRSSACAIGHPGTPARQEAAMVPSGRGGMLVVSVRVIGVSRACSDARRECVCLLVLLVSFVRVL